MTRMVGMVHDIAPDPDHEARVARSQADAAIVCDHNHFDGPEHVIVGYRQEGKTRLALDWVQNPPEGITRVLLVRDDNYARMLKSELGWAYNDPRIRTWQSIHPVRGRKADPAVEYGIDEAHEVLTQLLRIPQLKLVTIKPAEPWQVTPA